MKDIDEKDSFWSLDSMLPPKPKGEAVKPKGEAVKPSSDVSATEISIVDEQQPKTKYPPISSSKRGEQLTFTEWLKARNKYADEQKARKKRVVRNYEPSSPLIMSVEVSTEDGIRPMTERFLADGMQLLSKEGAFSYNAPYSSVYPQYATMTEEQRRCYLGFRTEVRNGRFPRVDRAYIYLYLYELINIEGGFTPAERAERMASLLYGYRGCDDKLFADMCNWLADLCLIHGLSAPRCVFGEPHPRILRLARLREFFVKPDGGEKNSFELMLYTGGYDHRTSKYYAECARYYDAYIVPAVCYALAEISRTDSRFKTGEPCTVTRDSFFGAYRTVGARYTLIIKLKRGAGTEDEKRIISDLVKYAENCLRARLGIKQRLTVSSITLEQKALIKRYFAENAKDIPTYKPTVKAVVEKPALPDYELLYEPKKETLTMSGAEMIEMRSWSVTEKLVTAFDESDEAIPDTPDEPVSAFTGAIEAPSEPEAESDIRTEITALELIVTGDMKGFRELAVKVGILPDALVDSVNELLLEEINDVGVVTDGDSYRIAEWYTDEVNDIIKKYGKE